MLGIPPEQIAQHPSQITKDTKAYVGHLVYKDEQGQIVPIFEKLSKVEHIYTSAGRLIPRWEIKIGGKNAEELEAALKIAQITVGAYARDMLRNPKFANSLHYDPKKLSLVMLDSVNLGYPRGATTRQLLVRGDDLGLDKCPPEVGVYQRLADDLDQKFNSFYYIVMDRIEDSYGIPGIFGLGATAAADCCWVRVGLILITGGVPRFGLFTLFAASLYFWKHFRDPQIVSGLTLKKV